MILLYREMRCILYNTVIHFLAQPYILQHSYVFLGTVITSHIKIIYIKVNGIIINFLSIVIIILFWNHEQRKREGEEEIKEQERTNQERGRERKKIKILNLSSFTLTRARGIAVFVGVSVGYVSFQLLQRQQTELLSLVPLSANEALHPRLPLLLLLLLPTLLL